MGDQYANPQIAFFKVGSSNRYICGRSAHLQIGKSENLRICDLRNLWRALRCFFPISFKVSRGLLRCSRVKNIAFESYSLCSRLYTNKGLRCGPPSIQYSYWLISFDALSTKTPYLLGLSLLQWVLPFHVL